jgi:glycosyltransferase involved in cell wall biosynthesis
MQRSSKKQAPEAPESVALRYGIKPNIETVLFFGRIRPDKGVEDLIEAFDVVRRRLGRPVQLMLAGHAPPSFHDRLTERIKRLGLTEQTTVYPDYIDAADVWAIHQAANVAVFPYRSSSQSAAVQTAMACELPIIVTDVGGLAETIEHEQSGLVVASSPAGALVERLADSIIRMLNEPDSAKRMGEKAGNLSRTVFAWETIAQQMTAAAMSVPSL